MPSRTRPQPPGPTLSLTPTFPAPLPNPPAMLALPAGDTPGLFTSANLLYPTTFQPWHPAIATFISAMADHYSEDAVLIRPADAFAYVLANSYLLAVLNNTAIAYLLFRPGPSPAHLRASSAYSLDALLVHPAHRRRGAGAALIRELYCHAARRGVEAITAILPRSSTASSFFTSNGFIEAPGQSHFHTSLWWRHCHPHNARPAP